MIVYLGVAGGLGCYGISKDGDFDYRRVIGTMCSVGRSIGGE